MASVSGRVRLRGERLSVHCDEAMICASSEETGEDRDAYEADGSRDIDYGSSSPAWSDGATDTANGYREPAEDVNEPSQTGSLESMPPVATDPATVANGSPTLGGTPGNGNGSINGHANGKSNGTGYSKGRSNGAATANGKSNGNGYANGNGHNNGNGHSNGKVNGSGNGVANGNGNGHYRTVLINLRESTDGDEDVQLLNDVKKLLLEYPGADHVNLTIETPQGQLRMEWPLVSTSYCDGLQASLEEILGPGSVQVEDVHSNGS